MPGTVAVASRVVGQTIFTSPVAARRTMTHNDCRESIAPRGLEVVPDV